MKTIRLVMLVLGMLCIVPMAYAGKQAEGDVLKVDISPATDSTGRKIKRLIVVTEQTKIPMPSIVNVYVLVKGSDDKIFFGKERFLQPQRLWRNMRSVDEWEFQILTDKIDKPDVVAYFVTLTNGDNNEVIASKTKASPTLGRLKASDPKTTPAKPPSALPKPSAGTRPPVSAEERNAPPPWVKEYESGAAVTVVGFTHRCR